MNPKFKIGDTVKFHISSEQTSHDNEAGQVLEIHFDGKEYSYKISAQYYDVAERIMAGGFKWLPEDECVLVDVDITPVAHKDAPEKFTPGISDYVEPIDTTIRGVTPTVSEPVAKETENAA